MDSYFAELFKTKLSEEIAFSMYCSYFPTIISGMLGGKPQDSSENSKSMSIFGILTICDYSLFVRKFPINLHVFFLVRCVQVSLCTPANNETYQERLLRLEGDKESLVLQVRADFFFSVILKVNETVCKMFHLLFCFQMVI